MYWVLKRGNFPGLYYERGTGRDDSHIFDVAHWEKAQQFKSFDAAWKWKLDYELREYFVFKPPVS